MVKPILTNIIPGKRTLRKPEPVGHLFLLGHFPWMSQIFHR